MNQQAEPSPDDEGGQQEAIDPVSEAFPPVRRFADMNLRPELDAAIEAIGFSEPTDVQARAFPIVGAGKDILVESKTGTGKTAAFGIPLLQKLEGDSDTPQVLVLAPTRELALQVAAELERLSAKLPSINIAAVYGGAAMGKQTDQLKSGASIVCGTPGRVLDHIRRKNFITKGIHTLVLDECDEMLSMGFQEEIENIINTLPAREKRQNLLFSATVPPDIERIANRHMQDPVKLALAPEGINIDLIDHRYYVVNGIARARDLTKIMASEKPESAIIFCNTREETNTVARYLLRNGYNARAISSDLSQKEREKVMKAAKAGTVDYLVATDIAARGIDISDLSHVINYTFPESAEVYVHRTGRTGRAGKTGIAVSMVGPQDIGSFYILKKIYKIAPTEYSLPSKEEFAAMVEDKRFEKALEYAQKSTQQIDEGFRSLARRVKDSEEGEKLIGLLLKELLTPTSEEIAQALPADEREFRKRIGRDDRDRGGARRGRDDRDSRGARGGRDRDRGRDRDKGRDEQRGKRSSRRDRDEGGEPSGESDKAVSARLYINIGKREEVSSDEVRKLIADAIGSGEAVQSVALRNTHSYVRVAEEHADTAIDKLSGESYKEREIKIERAKR